MKNKKFLIIGIVMIILVIACLVVGVLYYTNIDTLTEKVSRTGKEEKAQEQALENLLNGDFTYFAGTYVADKYSGTLTLKKNGNIEMDGKIYEFVSVKENYQEMGTYDIKVKYWSDVGVAFINEGWNEAIFTIAPVGVHLMRIDEMGLYDIVDNSKVCIKHNMYDDGRGHPVYVKNE